MKKASTNLLAALLALFFLSAAAPAYRSEEPEAPSCKSNSECKPDQLCEFEEGICGDVGAGRCKARSEVCPKGFKPVCGCDGETYANDCIRRMAGVALRSDGECPAPMSAP